MALKHIGRLKSNRRKVIVAYRTLPGEPDNCLTVHTESLEAGDHDALIRVLESNAGQSAEEFADVLARNSLPDGRNMLAAFHQFGKLYKHATSEVEMTPDTRTTIGLDELNRIIADQKGVAVEDLAVKPADQPIAQVKDLPTEDVVLEEFDLDAPADVRQAAQAAQNEVLSDEELAAQYRSQADALFKEAKSLREQAEKLVPTKRKTKKVEEGA